MSALPPEFYPAVTFTVWAARAPDVLPRVLELFAKRNLVPDRWTTRRVGENRDRLLFEIELDAMEPRLADYMAASMRQIVNVESVVAEKVSLAKSA